MKRLMITMTAAAQKQFTGRPQLWQRNCKYAGESLHRWWGDELVRTDAGHCAIIGKNCG